MDKDTYYIECIFGDKSTEEIVKRIITSNPNPKRPTNKP